MKSRFNVELIRQQRNAGMTMVALAKEHGSSVSQIKQICNVKARERNKRHGKERYKKSRTLLPTYERLCKVCFKQFESISPTKVTCCEPCKNKFYEIQVLFAEIPSELLREHVAVYGVNVESALRVGLTLSELQERLDG